MGIAGAHAPAHADLAAREGGFETEPEHPSVVGRDRRRFADLAGRVENDEPVTGLGGGVGELDQDLTDRLRHRRSVGRRRPREAGVRAGRRRARGDAERRQHDGKERPNEDPPGRGRTSDGVETLGHGSPPYGRERVRSRRDSIARPDRGRPPGQRPVLEANSRLAPVRTRRSVDSMNANSSSPAISGGESVITGSPRSSARQINPASNSRGDR